MHELREYTGVKEQAAEVHNRPCSVHLIRSRIACKLAHSLHNDPRKWIIPHACGTHAAARDVDGIIAKPLHPDRFLEGLPSRRPKVYVIHNGIESLCTAPKERLSCLPVACRRQRSAAAGTGTAHCFAADKGLAAIMIGSRRHEAGRPLTLMKRISGYYCPAFTEAELRIPVHLKRFPIRARRNCGSRLVGGTVWPTALEAMPWLRRHQLRARGFAGNNRR